MPRQQRFKTRYPGVYYIMGKDIGTGKPEKIFYITYRKDGKVIEEKAGRQKQDDMTEARAARKRGDKIDAKVPTNKERREAEEAAKREKAKLPWTVDRLFEEYMAQRPENKKSLVTDRSRYNRYLKKPFGKKEPKDLLPLDVDRVRLKLLKTKSPQTVKHVLNLLTWIVNFGAKKSLCPGISFHIQKPTVNNTVTEALTPEQIQRLLKAADEHSNVYAGRMMKLALFSGLRRGEMFKLKWEDVDFERGFISIRGPKGGPDQVVPMNESAREVLKSIPESESEYVFPGQGGGQRKNISMPVNEIKRNAGLPENFRPLHGLRHTYASLLASSGQVDMYTLQKLLTHKSPQMTQRYAHLRDETLKRASDLAADIVNGAVNGKAEKVINLKSDE